jgi:hypothetical protein
MPIASYETKNFTSASQDWANALRCDSTAKQIRGANPLQCLRILAEGDVSTGTAAVVWFGLLDADGTIVYAERGTVTPTAMPNNLTGTAISPYKATVVFTQSGRDTVDLLGAQTNQTTPAFLVTSFGGYSASLRLSVATSGQI